MTARYPGLGGALLGVTLVAILASALLACGGGEPERVTPDGGVVAEEVPWGAEPGSAMPGAEPHEGPGDDSPVRDGGAPVEAPTERPGAAQPAPATGAGSGSGSPGNGGAGSPDPGAAAGADQDEATAGILRATSRRYEQVRSLQAEFVQELRNPLLGRTTRSAGTLYQRQPDRFLMQFSDPAGDIIVSDGTAFWLYYPSVDARQVIRSPGGPRGLDLHAQFIGDPVSRFDATSHGREDVRGRPAHVLTLIPREPLGYRSLKVWVDVDDHLVRRFELTEENGNVRHFELRDVVVNPSLPDRLFRFTPPADAQVIQR